MGTIYNSSIRIDDWLYYSDAESKPSHNGGSGLSTTHLPIGILEIEWEHPLGVSHYEVVALSTIMAGAHRGTLNITFVNDGDDVKYEWIENSD